MAVNILNGELDIPLQRFCRPEEVAAHVSRIAEAGDWRPRIDQIPYYHSAVIPT